MITKIVFVPSYSVVVKNDANDKLLWIDSKGVSEIRYGVVDVDGVDTI